MVWTKYIWQESGYGLIMIINKLFVIDFTGSYSFLEKYERNLRIKYLSPFLSICFSLYPCSDKPVECILFLPFT